MNKSELRYMKLLFLIMAFACSIIVSACNGSNAGDGSITEDGSQLSFTYEIPPYYVFAGDTVDLTSYENRERLDYELCSFTYSHINTISSIKRANRYFPLLEKLLRQEGMPDDLKYLAVVESSLNPFARSHAGAAGMWQFMEATAKDFGLTVNQYVDERYDIEKATHAACTYFRRSYSKFGNWMAVAASYNAGQGAASRFREQHMSDDATHWWMSTETSRYIFRMLAAKIVFSAPEKFGFSLKGSDLYPPISYDVVEVDTNITSLAAFAKKHGLTYYQLKDANPWLRSTTLKCQAGGRYIIKIPRQESMCYDPAKVKVHDRRWVID